LLFVGVSVTYLVVNEARDRGGATAQQEQPADAQTADAGAEDVSKVTVYYFHGTKRCQTCRKIEAYANEAVTAGFAKELEEGDMEWQTVNVDEPENEHFIEDYELVTRSVVLVETLGGEQQKWVNLDKVWELVGDKPKFVEYVTGNLSDFMEAADG
jgi:hypothetical protein